MGTRSTDPRSCFRCETLQLDVARASSSLFGGATCGTVPYLPVDALKQHMNHNMFSYIGIQKDYMHKKKLFLRSWVAPNHRCRFRLGEAFPCAAPRRTSP